MPLRKPELRDWVTKGILDHTTLCLASGFWDEMERSKCICCGAKLSFNRDKSRYLPLWCSSCGVSYDVCGDHQASVIMAFPESNPVTTFLNAILNNPDDDTTRLVFADYLEELEDLRAGHQRLHVALQAILRDPSSDARRLEYAEICERYGMQERAEHIRSGLKTGYSISTGYHPYEFKELIPGMVGIYSVHRGFVRDISLSTEQLVTYGNEIFSEQPIQEVTLTDFDTRFITTEDEIWVEQNGQGKGADANRRSVLNRHWPQVPIEGWKLPPPDPIVAGWDMRPTTATPLADIMEFARQMQAQGMPFSQETMYDIAGIERPT